MQTRNSACWTQRCGWRWKRRQQRSESIDARGSIHWIHNQRQINPVMGQQELKPYATSPANPVVELHEGYHGKSVSQPHDARPTILGLQPEVRNGVDKVSHKWTPKHLDARCQQGKAHVQIKRVVTSTATKRETERVRNVHGARKVATILSSSNPRVQVWSEKSIRTLLNSQGKSTLQRRIHSKITGMRGDRMAGNAERRKRGQKCIQCHIWIGEQRVQLKIRSRINKQCLLPKDRAPWVSRVQRYAGDKHSSLSSFVMNVTVFFGNEATDHQNIKNIRWPTSTRQKLTCSRQNLILHDKTHFLRGKT